MDDAEHGASMIGAMVARHDRRVDRGRVLQDNSDGARTDSCGRHQHTSAVGSGRADGHAGSAILLHELGTPAATRTMASDGVNDPVRVPWGQVLGTVAGSFTPSFLR